MAGNRRRTPSRAFRRQLKSSPRKRTSTRSAQRTCRWLSSAPRTAMPSSSSSTVTRSSRRAMRNASRPSTASTNIAGCQTMPATTPVAAATRPAPRRMRSSRATAGGCTSSRLPSCRRVAGSELASAKKRTMVWAFMAAPPVRRSQRRQHEAAELARRPFGLDRDLAVIGRAAGALVDEVAVDPDRDRVATALDDHAVPLAGLVLGAIGEVRDAPRAVAVDAPLLLRPAPLLHVGHRDVLADAPEVAGIADLQLALDRLREHAVEPPRRRSVHEHAAVAGLAGPAPLELEAVVAVRRVGDQVALGLAVADQQAVAHGERRRHLGAAVRAGHIGVPAGEVLAVAERDRAWFRGAGAVAGAGAGGAERDGGDGEDGSEAHGGIIALLSPPATSARSSRRSRTRVPSSSIASPNSCSRNPAASARAFAASSSGRGANAASSAKWLLSGSWMPVRMPSTTARGVSPSSRRSVQPVAATRPPLAVAALSSARTTVVPTA